MTSNGVLEKDILREAERINKSLGRSSLGEFAVSDIRFNSILGFFLIDVMAQDKSVSADIITEGFYKDIQSDRILPIADKADQWSEVVNEISFWRGIYPDVIPVVGTNVNTPEVVDRLSSAYWYHDLHKYFAIGIWDIRTALTYKLNGIDPELALVLSREDEPILIDS